MLTARSRIGAGSILRLFLISIAALTIFSCSDDNPTETERPGTLVTPSGGTVSDPGGASVMIPAGALAGDAYITITTYHENASIPVALGPCLDFACAADFGPDGLQFNAPVTVTFPSHQALTPGAQFPLFTYDEASKCWMQTEFLATVAADGQSFTAQIDHFSIWGGDGGQGESGLFDDLEDNLRQGDPEGAFEDFIDWFQQNVAGVGDKGVYGSECQEIIGIDFDLGYVVDGGEGSLFERVGETSDHTLQVSYSVDVGDQQGSFYMDQLVTIYIRCAAPDLSVEANPDALSDGEKASVTATMTCGSAPMSGEKVQFAVSGPGSVHPASGITSAQGEAETGYTADGEGTATVSASHTACQGSDPKTATGSAKINVGSWTGTLVMTFLHNPTNEEHFLHFGDVVTIDFDLVVVDSTVSGTGSGVHDVDVTVGPDCTIGSLNAPPFEAAVYGTVNGDYFDFLVLPLTPTDYPLSFTVNCGDGSVTVPVYSYLEVSIMALHMTVHVPREDGGSDSGSGTEGFGTDAPVDYSYSVTIHRGGGGMAGR